MVLYMESKQLVQQIVTTLDKHKAGDIQVLGVRDLTVIADYFVIATGTSSTQVKALADYVEFELSEQGVTPARVEGYQSSNWILLDYHQVIVHVFYGETREFYNLEHLWKDGAKLPLADFLPKESD